MKALLSHKPGGPESLVIEDIADPVPGPGQVLIKVRAVGVNFPDLLMIQDLYQFKPPRPFSPGSELAGVVETAGRRRRQREARRPGAGKPGAQRDGGEGHRAGGQLLEDP